MSGAAGSEAAPRNRHLMLSQAGVVRPAETRRSATDLLRRGSGGMRSMGHIFARQLAMIRGGFGDSPLEGGHQKGER